MANTTSAMLGKLKADLKAFVVLTAYLYVCLSALILYKMTIVGGSGDGFWPFGLPAIKALLLAKFMMAGHATRLGDRYVERRLIFIIALKAALYLILLILLSLAEEIVVGLIHGRTISASLQDLGGNTLPQILATSAIMLLILIPYFASIELSSSFENGLWGTLMTRRSAPRH